MRKIAEFLIQDRDNNLLAVLDPQECYSSVKDQTINADNTLELVLDVSHYAAQFLKKDNRIMYRDTIKNKWHEYVMSGIEQEGYKITVNAESSLYDTLSNWIDFIDITGNTVVTGLQKIFNTCSPKSNWNAGTSDITGNYQMQRTRYTLKEVIFAWANKVQGEIDERIVIYNDKPTRYVDIKKSIGSNKGKVLYDDRDLTDINIEVPVDTIYTMAYGYGKSETVEGTEESKPITFKDIVWTVAGGDPVDKPAGQEWVALPDEYKQKYGYYDTNGVLQHRATGYEESGVEVPSELLQRTYDFLLQNVQDQTIYKLTAADYRALNLNPIEISLGDVIGARIAKLGDIYISSKVLRYKEDLKNPDNNEFDLENSAKSISDNLINNERQITDLKNRIDRIGDIVFTQNILDKWNQEINAESGYLVVGSPQDGLAVYNAPTIVASTKAVQLKGGSIRIANTKTNGQFDWSTVMTGDGIIADALYTGILAGNMFDLDLDSGIVKMGKRNASGVIDAPALQLNADGSITMKIGGADLNTTINNITNVVGDLNTSVEDVIQKVDNIAVGATNLLENSGYRKNINGVNYRGNHTATRDIDNAHNGNNTLKIVATGVGTIGTNDVYQYLDSTGKRKVNLNDNLLISFYVKGTVGRGQVRLGNSSTEKTLVQFNITAGWNLIKLDLGKIDYATNSPVIMFIFNQAGTYYLNSIMLEYGTEHTTWSMAPQDTSNGLTVVEQDVVIAQNNIVSLQTGLNGIQADVGQITTTLTTLKSAGSNLLRNTALVDGKKYWNFNVRASAQIEPYTLSSSEFKHMAPPTGLDTVMMIIRQLSPAITTTEYNSFNQLNIKVKPNTQYIASCWYYVPQNGDIDKLAFIQVVTYNAENTAIRYDSKYFEDYTVDQWHYFEISFTTVDAADYMSIDFGQRNRGIIYFSSMYLGLGNVSTGWSPNEADINVEIKTTKTDLAQLHIETDNITQRVTKVEQQEIGVANVLKDSGEQVVTTDYLMRSYNWYGVKPNTTYTIVMNGFTSVATKKIGVWFNGGTAQGGYFPVTTTAKTMVLKVTTPATLTQQYISFYNYPSGTAGTGTINWVAMYEGDVKPPLTWTAAPQELAKISYVEQKTTAEALTTTISSGLAGDASLQTTKFVMNKNGLSIYNGGIKIFNNFGSQVFGADTDGNLEYQGSIRQISSRTGNLTLRVRNSTIEYYAPRISGQLVAIIGSSDVAPGGTQGIIIGHEAGAEITISKKNDSGLWGTQIGIKDNQIRFLTPIYVSYPNSVTINGGLLWSNLHGEGGYALNLYSNEYVQVLQEANHNVWQEIRARDFIKGCTTDQKKGIKPATKEDIYSVLEETDFYSYYERDVLRKAIFRNEKTSGVPTVQKSITPVIGDNYKTAPVLTGEDIETSKTVGLKISTIACVAAAHTKQLKEDFDKTVLDLENKIKALQEQLDNAIMK